MRRSAGFTLIEFLVVVGIIAILLALLIPAVVRGREAARRISCVNNLKQLALSLQSYHASHEVFPSGSVNETRPILSVAHGQQMSWITSVLPFMEQNAVFNAINFDLGAFAIENRTARTVTITVFNCPDAAPEASGWLPSELFRGGAGERRWWEGTSTYAGVYHDVEAPIDVDNHGALFLNSRIAAADARDGLSQTLFIGEIPFRSDRLGWMSGSRSTLRNTGQPINRADARTLEGARLPEGWAAEGSKLVELERAIDSGEARISPAFVGGFGSNHRGGAIFAFGDGSARYLKETIDPFVFRCLGNRLDGEAIDESEY